MDRILLHFIAAAARKPEATEQGSSLINRNIYILMRPFVHLSGKMQSIVFAEISKWQGIVVNFGDTTMQHAALLCLFLVN